jgi:hypothetical protein
VAAPAATAASSPSAAAAPPHPLSAAAAATGALAAKLLAGWAAAGYMAVAELAAAPGLLPALDGCMRGEHDELATAAAQLRWRLCRGGRGGRGGS